MSKIFMFPIKYDRAAAETFRVEPTFFMRMRPRRSTSRLAQNNFDIFRRLRWSSVRDLYGGEIKHHGERAVLVTSESF